MDPKKTEKKFEGKGKPAKADKRVKDRKFPKLDKREEKPYLGRNNIEWRTSDAVMTELVGRLPFGVPSGLPQTLNCDRGNQSATIQRTLPGIMSIRTRLCVGGNTAALNYNSAINLAGRKLYSFIRHANSGSKNYEAADLTIYLIAIQQALGLLGWLQRLYAIINAYSATNRYTPRALVSAMGVDFDDMIANQPQLKYLIAWFGRAIGALAFPDLRIMHASYEAYKWIIRDSDSPKEQFYILDSAGFAKYDPVLTTVGGGITYTTSQSWCDPYSPSKFAALTTYVHEIMDVLLSDEDCGIISGDILKAYRDGGLFTVEAFGDYDPIVKDEEILQQIHNAHIIPESQLKINTYEQKSGGTSTAPYITPTFTAPTSNTDTSNVISFGHYLTIDAFSKVPDAKEVVNCTVLNPQYDLAFVVGAGQVYVDSSKLSFDLHLPVEVYVVYDLSNGGFNSFGTYLSRRPMNAITMPATYHAQISAFDWHPYVMQFKSGATPSQGLEFIGDKQNFRMFDYDVGVRIHENSILSLLNFTENNFNDKRSV